jgi:hypothetical protein
LVFQDFSTSPSVPANPLNAHIGGGHAYLCRYAQSAEQPLGLMRIPGDTTSAASYYNPYGSNENYYFPNQPAGSIIDAAYTKLWIKNALLNYFNSPINGAYRIVKVNGNGSQITSIASGGQLACYFATSGGISRTGASGNTIWDEGAFYNRDVQVGDVVQVTDSSTDSVLWTYVQGLIADTIPAVVASNFSADAGNATQSVQTASSTVTFLTPSLMNDYGNNGGIAVVNLSGWSAIAGGQVSETYTVVVVQGSVNGQLNTATISLLSASGNDNVLNFSLAGMSQATLISGFAIGNRGLQLKFVDTKNVREYSESAKWEDEPPNDLIAGQRWSVYVQQAYTAPTLTPVTNSPGYNSPTNTTYIVDVVRGGVIGSTGPQVRISTSNGVDMTGPMTVTGTGAGNLLALGSLGLWFYFGSGVTGLVKGDTWYLQVTGTTVGGTRTMVLGHTLPVANNSTTTVGISLYIPEAVLQIPASIAYLDGTSNTPFTAWSPTTDAYGVPQVTVNSGIFAYDQSYTKTWPATGETVPVHLPVVSNAPGTNQPAYSEMYLEFRAWLSDLANSVSAISDAGNLSAQISGALDPDNPLMWGVYMALQNSNGANVMYTAVTDPNNLDAWDYLLELIEGNDQVYGLVPLSTSQQVQALYAAHVNDESTPTLGDWRVAWFALQGCPAIPIVWGGTLKASPVQGYTTPTTTDGAGLACTFTVPSGGTAATLVTCPTHDGAFGATINGQPGNNVQPGDIVRTNFTLQSDGTYTYDSFVVQTVVNNDEFLLATTYTQYGVQAVASTAIACEIWRTTNKTQEATAIGTYAGSWGNRRIRAVWPDTIEAGGTSLQGYYLCAALAGEASGILPHQGMTNLQITGFSSTLRTTRFNRDQLDIMAGAGVWIVTQDPISGNIYTRHAVTTGVQSDINQREEMITRNVDSISFQFKQWFAPYIGVTNVTPSMQDRLAFDVRQLVDKLKTANFTTELGGQLIDATIVSLAPSPTLADRYVLILNCTIPVSLDNFEIHLVL